MLATGAKRMEQHVNPTNLQPNEPRNSTQRTACPNPSFYEPRRRQQFSPRLSSNASRTNQVLTLCVSNNTGIVAYQACRLGQARDPGCDTSHWKPSTIPPGRKPPGSVTRTGFCVIYGVKTGTGVIIPSSAGCKLSFRLISGGNYHARHRNATQSRWPRQTKRQAHAKLASAIALEMSNIFHSHLFGEQCPARVRSRHTSSSSSRYLQRAGANHAKRRLHPVQ